MTEYKVELEDYLLWEGKLAKIVAKASYPTVVIEIIEDEKCPHCQGNLGKRQFSVVPTSPLFKENAKPINTIKQ